MTHLRSKINARLATVAKEITELLQEGSGAMPEFGR
jgi:hypothetical protein